MNDQEEDSLENLINVMTLLLSEYCFIQGLFGEVICYMFMEFNIGSPKSHLKDKQQISSNSLPVGEGILQWYIL